MIIFSELGLSQLPRILGLIDRDNQSKTFGCCDRNYWHYKVIDFPNSRSQEAALVLALASQLNSPNSKFFNVSILKDWAAAVSKFWAQHRHADGSVDESFPYERHFCATAFTLYSITESLILFGEKPSWDPTPSGRFLLRLNNPDVANQMACASEALLNLYTLTGDKQFLYGAEDKIIRLLQMQSNEGYFNEYGGFDLGYDTITLSFLASIFLKTQRPDIKEAALRCIDHLRSYIDESGYYSPEQMSRKTQFLYPYGFAIFAPDILKRMEIGLRNGIILNPSWMDDRYCVPLTANFLKTAKTFINA